MQILLGMILGVLITIGAAFVYDNSTGRAANGLTVASAEGHAPMVNWDVVSHDWDGMKQQLRDVAVDIERGWKANNGLNYPNQAQYEQHPHRHFPSDQCDVDGVGHQA